MPTDPTDFLDIDRAVAAAFRLDEGLAAREGTVSLGRAEAALRARRTRRRILPAAGMAFAFLSTAALLWNARGHAPAPEATPTPSPAPLRPEPGFAQARRIDAALRAAPHVHVTIAYPGFHRKTRTIWREGKRFRDETDERLYLFDGARRWLWIKEKNLALTWRRFPEDRLRLSAFPNIRSGLNYPSSALADLIVPPWGIRNRGIYARILRSGKDAEDKPRKDGVSLWLAPVGDLPLREIVRSRTDFDWFASDARWPAPAKVPDGYGGFLIAPPKNVGGGGGIVTIAGPIPSHPIVATLIASARYDEAPPAGTFRFAPPAGVAAVDLDERSRRWRAVESAPPLAALPGGFAIRHVVVGTEGEVFVLHRGIWPGGHRSLSAGQVVAPGLLEIVDDRRRRYSPLGASATPTLLLPEDGDRSGEPLRLTVLSPLRVPSPPAKELRFRVTGPGGGTAMRLALPPPLTTERPEYLALLAPFDDLAGPRTEAARGRVMGGADEIRRGRPAMEVAAECEALVAERLHGDLSWSLALKLARIDEAAGLADLAAKRALEARSTFVSGQQPGAPLPAELQSALERLAP